MPKVNKTRISAFLLILLILSVLDGVLTVHLVESFPEGQELNPFVNTKSTSALFFSPSHMLVMSATLACLAFSEINCIKFLDFIKARSLFVFPFIFPTYYAISRALSVLNNVFPLLGISTPIHWIRMPFQKLTESEFMQTVYAEFFFLILIFPFLIYLAKKFYPCGDCSNADYQ